MNDLLNSLSRKTLAFLALTGGVLFIVFSDPPHTVCDSQNEIFKESQAGFLYPAKKTKFKTQIGFKRFSDRCKVGNSAGACLELFMGLRKLTKDLQGMPQMCRKEMGSKSEVKNSIQSGLDTMIRVAWASRKMTGRAQRYGWLDESDLSVFCSLQDAMSQIYGEGAWVQFRDSYFKKLAGSGPQKTTRDQIWNYSILSYKCNY